MKVTYDIETDCIYIKFQSKEIGNSNADKNGNLYIDYAADGSVVGIEVLNASQKMSIPVELDFISA